MLRLMMGWHQVSNLSPSDCLLSSYLFAFSTAALISPVSADQFPKRFPLASCRPVAELFRDQSTDASGRRTASLRFGDDIFTLSDAGAGRLCEHGCTMEHRNGKGEVERFAIVSDKVAEEGRPASNPTDLPMFSRDYYVKTRPGHWLWLNISLRPPREGVSEIKRVKTLVFDERGWSDRDAKLTSCLG
jgi:hypothetical protein